MHIGLISIIAFNKAEPTKRCVETVLRAVARQSSVHYHVLLQDNASTDHVPEVFREAQKHYTYVRVKRYDTNTGFQIPTENAFSLAKDLGAEFLVLVNNDCIPPDNFLQIFFEDFKRLPTTAILGCRGTCCTVGADVHGYESPRTEYVEMSCACIDVKKVSRHYPRLFDPYLRFAYSEDLLLSLKMQKMGYRVGLSNFYIDHARGSTSQSVPEAKKAQEENHEAMKKHWGHWLKHRTFSHRIIVQREAAHGDVLMCQPIIEALYHANPLCKIYLETACVDVLKGCPYLSGIQTHFGKLEDDLIINLNNSYENAPMRHVITSYARAAGLENVAHKCKIYPGENKFKEIESGKWCAMHVDRTTWPGKNWPLERFSEVADALRSEGWKVVLVGRGDDHFPSSDCDARRKTNTQELAAVIKKCGLAICADSFPMHVSLSVGTPTIGIFGVTSSRFLMHGSNYIGCDADPLIAPTAGIRHRVAGQTMVFENGEAIRTVSVAQVLDAVQKLTGSKVLA